MKLSSLKSLSACLAAITLAVLFSSGASAQIYNVDWNVGYADNGTPANNLTRGYSVLGSGLEIYNSIAQTGLYGRSFELHAGTTNYSSDTLYDSNGNASAINFTNPDLGSGGANIGEYNNGGNGNGYQQGGSTSTPPAVAPNYINNNNNGTPTTRLTITFSGLAASTVYNVVAYDLVTTKGSAARTSFFSVNGGTTYSVTTTGSNDTAFSSTSTTPYATGDLSYIGNYVEMQGTSTASGTMTLAFWGTAGAESDFSGFSLQSTGQVGVLEKTSSRAPLLAGVFLLGLFSLCRFQNRGRTGSPSSANFGFTDSMNSYCSLYLKIITILGLGLLFSSRSFAQSINIDFGSQPNTPTQGGSSTTYSSPTYTGPGVLGTGSEIWNQVGSNAGNSQYTNGGQSYADTIGQDYLAGTSAPLLDSNGNTTAIKFTSSFFPHYDNTNNGADSQTPGNANEFTSTFSPNLYNAYERMGNGFPNQTLTISGLAASTTYNIVVYGGNQSVAVTNSEDFDVNANGGTEYELINQSNQSAFVNIGGATPYTSYTPAGGAATSANTYEGNYLEFTGTSTSAGVLVLNITEEANTALEYNSINQVQISGVQLEAIQSGPAFTNPIIPVISADPFIKYYNGKYYAMRTPAYSGVVDVYSSATLGGLNGSSPTTLLNLNDPYESPELFLLNGNWYVYCTTPDSGQNPANNIHVLKSSGTNPLGPYTSQGVIESSAYDGDVLQMNGTNYFLSTPGGVIYIQQMSSPTALMGSPSTISSENQVWEINPGGGATFNLMEAPEAVQHNADYFIFYTTGDYETNGYMVGVLKYQGGSPLLASSWKKLPGPLFLGNGGNSLGAGDCTPFVAADGSWWFTYSAYQGSFRSVRVQRMSWDSNGNPVFPIVVDPGASMSEP